MSKQKVKRPVLLILLASMAVVLIIGPYIFYHIDGWKVAGGPSNWGSFGDYLGGILNPLVGIVGVLLLYQTFALQRKELKQARKQFKRTSKALEKQTSYQLYKTEMDLYTSAVTKCDHDVDSLIRFSKMTLGDDSHLIDLFISKYLINEDLEKVKASEQVMAAIKIITDAVLYVKFCSRGFEKIDKPNGNIFHNVQFMIQSYYWKYQLLLYNAVNLEIITWDEFKEFRIFGDASTENEEKEEKEEEKAPPIS